MERSGFDVENALLLFVNSYIVDQILRSFERDEFD